MTTEASVSFSGAYDIDRAEPFNAGVIQWIRKPGSGERPDLGCGFWTVNPSEAPKPVEVLIHADETVHIVKGRVRVEVVGGPTHELAAGGVASFNKGTRTVWTIQEPTIEFFVYS